MTSARANPILVFGSLAVAMAAAPAIADVKIGKVPGAPLPTSSPVPTGRGFFVTGLSMASGRTDAGDRDESGQPGSRMFYPGYSLGDWQGDSIDIHWGVWRSHLSPSFSLPGYDSCQSNYQVALTVVGPAGVSPF